MNGNRAALPLLALLLAMAPALAQTRPELVFVGSGRRNIEAFRLDPASGALTPLGRAAEIEHPSFLAIAPNHRFLYAVSEGTDAASSGVSAFAIDPAAGKLRLLNRQPSGGSGPCYVAVDAGGSNVHIANYGSGSVAVFPLAGDGAFGPRRPSSRTTARASIRTGRKGRTPIAWWPGRGTGLPSLATWGWTR